MYSKLELCILYNCIPNKNICCSFGLWNEIINIQTQKLCFSFALPSPMQNVDYMVLSVNQRLSTYVLSHLNFSTI